MPFARERASGAEARVHPESEEGEVFSSAGAKARLVFMGLYAALKRRSSTVLHVFPEFSSGSENSTFLGQTSVSPIV
jgi:hypothetical protein